MGKIQKNSRLIRSDLLFFILILLLIITLFVILSPKVSNRLFSFKREAILTDFISATKRNGFIDPQEYWKFREFYSPGYFTFSRNGIEKTLVFTSPLVSSLDTLTTQTNLNRVIAQSIPKDNIIFSNKNSLIYEENPKIIKIVFLLSNADMRRANGFFDYNGQDKKLLENKNWLNITVIKK